MQKIRINSASGDSVVITGGSLADLGSLVAGERLFIITDSNVRALYGHTFPAGEVLTVEPGEGSKTMSVVEDLCRTLLEAGADRSSYVLGFGGGVVCDIAGMVASVYMRGVRHSFVSTTLLSQVDASIGGKNGVNLGTYKNMIGTFKQPEFVLCDHSTLDTLPETEFLSGLGELIKHGAISDRSLFLDISDYLTASRDTFSPLPGDLIHRAVSVKAAIVKSDPLERGKRKLLNFGHTFGHVLETAYSIPHGIAVMEGMLIAAELSVWTGDMPLQELKLLEGVIGRTGTCYDHPLPGNVIGIIARDKKGREGTISMVLLKSAGRAVIRKMSLAELHAFVEYYSERRGFNNKTLTVL